ncbi:glycoside hydrolase family 3 N-terminal domain-containing protein [Nitrospirillum sp. BR 11163]|uniref:glycoside hydrolase family 3 N-terminal domain-containing protein n=1 Tax=Nitrospirillum sp. BR 11163 TaxID=3104323 RepID=UPI002AFED26E|nr:glycoside hydrolase family 3 N-terminal domain-containing protein [Nitrospirillum sp. BR 11163]MEA1671796.1 glycoside hydrolase family 3 N-terminal domain-containing protein [Nitrospirillum sp. BR 11163]
MRIRHDFIHHRIGHRIGRRLILAGVAAVAISAAAHAADKPAIYKDAGAPVAARVDDLLARMTLDEKVAQLIAVWDHKPAIFDAGMNFDPAKASGVYPNGLGQFTRPNDEKGSGSLRVQHWRDTRGTVAMVNAVQHWALEKTRLGIPVLFHEEGLHGYPAIGPTSFPQAIAQASSWDPDLIREVDSVVAREIRVRGVSLVLSPVVDVARDPRWGRIEETFGEDPYLAGEMGVAAVQGLQGDSLPLADGKVFATLKHLTGHGQPESGTNVGPASVGERTLREMFFPPFEQVIHRTNVRAVMASYNEIDGVPSHVNTWLLHDILRGEWGYKGSIISDYSAIDQLVSIHHVVPDLPSAAICAIQAGVDADLPDGESYASLAQAVRAGRIKEEVIDRAVRRILELKFQAGLFEHPYADADKAEALTANGEARAVALKAAQKSVVLLKNDGVLPLDMAKVKTLAVIGPNAAKAHLGGYSGEPKQTISILDGIKAKVGSRVKVTYAEGVRITKDDDWYGDTVELADPAENARLIQQAVAVAKVADHIVLVIGDNEQTSREGWANNHLGDRDSLDLVGQQNDLAKALFALGKPVVVVLQNGRPLSVVDVAAKSNALVEGWYLGQEGGTAMADVLFGDVNPGGKLPVTVPRSVGQLPMFYNKKPSARRGYLFDTTDPLFPFGYGLSYTTFDVGAPRLSTPTIAKDGAMTVSVDVRNTGKRAGDEVVQLYLHQQVASVTRPVKELKGFQRITLAPGESRTVTFTVDGKALALWNQDMKRVVEPGAFDIMVGDNSVDLKTAVLTVTE